MISSLLHTSCRPGTDGLPRKPCDALWEQIPHVGKQGDMIFDCDLLLDPSLREARQMYPDQSSIIVCSCSKVGIFAPLRNWSWLVVNWSSAGYI